MSMIRQCDRCRKYPVKLTADIVKSGNDRRELCEDCESEYDAWLAMTEPATTPDENVGAYVPSLICGDPACPCNPGVEIASWTFDGNSFYLTAMTGDIYKFTRRP